MTSASAPSRSLSGQFVERFTHAWAQRDPELLGALFEPDASVRQPPVRHAFRGDEIPAYFREVFQLLPDIHLEPYDVVDVPKQGDFTGTNIFKTFFRSVVPTAMSSLGTSLPTHVIY